MNPVKIKFTIDLDNDVQVKLAKQFMSDLKGTSGERPVIEAAIETVRTKVQNEQPAAQSASNAAEAKKPSVTLDMISKAVSEKVQLGLREEVKDKLDKLNVARASELDPSQYKEFYNHVMSLKAE